MLQRQKEKEIEILKNIIKLFFSSPKIDINIVNNSGKTALSLANSLKNEEIKDLVKSYANLFDSAKSVTDPILLREIFEEAIIRDYSAIVKYLIKKGVRVFIEDLNLAKDNT